MDVTLFYEAHLRENLTIWFPDFSRAEIQLISESPRISATLFRYEIRSQDKLQKVIIKQRHPRPPSKAQRPLRFQIADEEKFALEAQALREIDSYFTKLADPRFGAIRVLDILPEQQALIMVESQDPDLRRSFLKANRFQGEGKNLLPIFANAGAWLKHFHSFAPREGVQVAYTKASDYLDALQSYCGYLSDMLKQAQHFQAINDQIGEMASKTLPSTMPSARLHNDFTMRNILVSESGAVTVIDTLSKWQSPIYEDLAYFLLRLRTNQIQVFTQGMAYSDSWIDDCATAFLKAYFGEEKIPNDILNMYQALALLDQWTSQVESLSRNRKIQNRLRLTLINRHYQSILERLIREK